MVYGASSVFHEVRGATGGGDLRPGLCGCRISVVPDQDRLEEAEHGRRGIALARVVKHEERVSTAELTRALREKHDRAGQLHFARASAHELMRPRDAGERENERAASRVVDGHEAVEPLTA